LLVFNNPNPTAFDGLLEQARQKTQIPDRDIDEKISNFSSAFFHDMKTFLMLTSPHPSLSNKEEADDADDVVAAMIW
jgi:hypothetical protein